VNVVTALDEYLRKNNKLVEGFLMMKEQLDIERARARRAGEPERELKLLFSLKHDVGRQRLLSINQACRI
jgi:hypothetical protein